MSYLALKHLHISFVVISICLFVYRGGKMLAGSEQASWARWLPHVVDTLLLGAALGLLWVGHINPLQQPWLLLKLLCLVAYVILGSIALKHGKTQQIRTLTWLAALAVLAYMLKLALSKQIWF